MRGNNWVWVLVLSNPRVAFEVSGAHYFDDDGDIPDGDAWLCESADVEKEDLRRVVDAHAGYLALGIKVEYDGSNWKELHDRFCDHWCGYASKGVAYGLPSRVKEINGATIQNRN